MVVVATHTGIALDGAERLDLSRFRSERARHSIPQPPGGAISFEDETW
jgi:hypothetical protein